MKTMRLVGLVLVVTTCMGVHPSKAEAATAWSTNGADCVPVGTFGVHVAAGAVTAGGGATVTLYCAITRDALVGAFRNIEITYRGVAGTTVFTSSQLIQKSKATGAETVKCGVQSRGSTSIKTQRNLCKYALHAYPHTPGGSTVARILSPQNGG
jgi:hypothetical protein